MLGRDLLKDDRGVKPTQARDALLEPNRKPPPSRMCFQKTQWRTTNWGMGALRTGRGMQSHQRRV